MGCGGKKKVVKEDSIYLDDDMMEESVYTDEEDELTVDIMKSNADQHLVFGWANVALQADGSVPLDWQGDITAPKVLEKAAYNFVLKFRETGEQHKGSAVGVLVESCMFTKEKMAAIGIPEGTVPEGWWVGFYVPSEEICMKIKEGKYKMFSIQGKAKKLKL